MSTKKSNDFSFEINGVTIKSNTLYQITDKYDADAPQAFRDRGISKMPQRGISEIVPCLFDGYKNVWDTGFYESSSCYTGTAKSDVKTIVTTLQTHIVKPFEELRGEGVLTHMVDPKTKENDFWDNYGVRLYTGRVLNTARPEDLLDLYIAARHNHIVRKEDSGQHFAMKAKYCVVNKEEATTVKEERRNQKAEAIGNLYTLLTTDREKLMYVLEYLGLVTSHDIEDKTILSVVMAYLEEDKNSHENVKRFKQTIDYVNTQHGLDELYTHSNLIMLYKKGKIVRQRSEYFLDDLLVGNTLKEGAKKAMKDPQLNSAVLKLVEEIEEKAALKQTPRKKATA